MITDNYQIIIQNFQMVVPMQFSIKFYLKLSDIRVYKRIFLDIVKAKQFVFIYFKYIVLFLFKKRTKNNNIGTS